MKNNHRHTMRADRQPMPTVYKCASCEFRCTPRALMTVERTPGSHRVVKAAAPGHKPAVWDLSGVAS